MNYTDMEIHMNRKLLPLIALAVFALTVVGCASNKGKIAKNDSVMDVNVAPVPPREPEVAYATPGHQPAYYDASVTQTPAGGGAVTPAAATAGSTYVVKKGDTLFSIAKASYGNGNQWQRIASANPGLSPSTLKAGQKITLP
jgi:5'-nucleotidase